MEPSPQPALCPRCQRSMHPALVRTDIWREGRLYVVEDVPAYICDLCLEQFYDEDVTDALRRLNEDGFSSIEPKREMIVPVFSLEGRVQRALTSGQQNEST